MAIKHGCAKQGAHTRAYKIWRDMKKRCNARTSAMFHHYGGRGIGICDDWMNFSNFLADMGEPDRGLTIERVDNNKGYSKENCRWAIQHLEKQDHYAKQTA